MRRRIYLMRHGDVAYFDKIGKPVPPDNVELTRTGMAQAGAAGDVFSDIAFDRVIASGLVRTVETAQIVVSRTMTNVGIEEWPELREIRGGRLRNIPKDQIEKEFLSAFQGFVPESTRFLGGETIGELLDRVIPAIERLRADDSWDTALLVLHGGVNRAILSYAMLGGRGFIGNLAQSAGCINALDVGSDWIVRAVNFSPTNPAHVGARKGTMEVLLEQYLPYRNA